MLFEIATLGPGFATDEPAEHLGERLSLPPAFEHLRDQRRAGADAAAESARRGSVSSAELTESSKGAARPAACSSSTAVRVELLA